MVTINFLKGIQSRKLVSKANSSCIGNDRKTPKFIYK